MDKWDSDEDHLIAWPFEHRIEVISPQQCCSKSRGGQRQVQGLPKIALASTCQVDAARNPQSLAELETDDNSRRRQAVIRSGKCVRKRNPDGQRTQDPPSGASEHTGSGK